MATGDHNLSSAEVRSVLKKELGKALSCYERALFFANTIPVNDNSLYKIGPNNDLPAKITLIYSRAALILRDRHVCAVKRYIEAYTALEGTSVADRDMQAISKSADHVWTKFSNVADDATTIISNTPSERIDYTLDDLKWNWLGLSNISRLFMEEITHLNYRVDNFDNTRRTRRSIRYGIIGISLGAVFSLLSLFVNLAEQKKEIGSDFFIEIGKAKADLATLEQSSDIEPNNALIPASGPPLADHH